MEKFWDLLSRVWGLIAFVGSIVLGLVGYKALSKLTRGQEARTKALEESHARAEAEAKEKHAAVDRAAEAELASIERFKSGQLSAHDARAMAAQREIEEKIDEKYTTMSDDEETRAHLRSLLDDGGGPADD